MSSIGSRQISVGCASVPPIKRAEKVDMEGYETIVEVFTEALMKKQCYEYNHSTEAELEKYGWKQNIIDTTRAMYKDCLQQTVTFLKHIHALKPAKPIKEIQLWKDCIKMSPFYEGVNVNLKSMLIKHHCPRMAEAMSKGATYAHQTLTDIGECVLYLMEYFQKGDLFEPVEKVIKTKEVIKWVEDHNKWVTEHKKEIEQKEKASGEYRKKEMEDLKKSMDKLGSKRPDFESRLSDVSQLTDELKDITSGLSMGERIEGSHSKQLGRPGSAVKKGIKPPKQFKQPNFKQPRPRGGRRY